VVWPRPAQAGGRQVSASVTGVGDEHGVPDGPFTGVTLAGVAGSLRDGTTDPVALTRRALAAIEAAQPAVNAFVTVDHDAALAAAALAADELAGGVDRGPLHGVPVAVKDLVDTAGLVTTMGSRHFAGHVPAHDAEVVRRLRAAGAVIVGKTTTHEFAYGPTGDRAANGPCANPHDSSRMAGGSSAGSAAAVAAGLVPLAVGTDTGGSVRIPAALCGVVGIRPSPDRVPTNGVFPLSWSLDSVGVMAADVAGTATGWQVCSGATAAAPAVRPDALRIGLPLGFDRVDDVVRHGFDGLVDRLAAHGARLAPVEVPDVEELRWLYRTIQSVEAVAVHHDRMTNAPQLFDPEVLQRLRIAAQVPARDYAVALRRFTEVRAAAGRLLDGLDLLLLPTVPIVAPPLGARDTDIGGGWTSPRDALLAHNTPFSVLGLPSVSIPVAAPGVLPVGVQLVGRPHADEALLSAALAVERLS
jgi:Asp-tRNA(Asn)/Glu-tRNA(Gln) amidotransferase A subunit family amidase